MNALELCERIVALDDERRRLEAELFMLTGKSFDEFADGMRRLLMPARPRACTSPAEYVMEDGRVLCGPHANADGGTMRPEQVDGDGSVRCEADHPGPAD